MDVDKLPKMRTLINDDTITFALPTEVKGSIYGLKTNYGINPSAWMREVVLDALYKTIEACEEKRKKGA